MKCSTETIPLMHKYLDEEISEAEKKQLKGHISQCEDCNQHFHELKRTIALVQSTSHIEAPSDFTFRVMQSLPKEKQSVRYRRWFSHHPLITAASLFFLLMSASLFSFWNGTQEFSVSKKPQLVIENNTVIVPEGETVEGDIVVKNGRIVIEGEVKGDVTLINGEQYLASAGNVTGEIKEVNQLFEWIWYHMKKVGKDVIEVFDQSNE